MMATESDEPYMHVAYEAMLHEDHTFKPSSPEANAAYLAGLCKVCHVEPRRPGGTECYGCYNYRMDYNMGLPLREREHHGS